MDEGCRRWLRWTKVGEVLEVGKVRGGPRWTKVGKVGRGG